MYLNYLKNIAYSLLFILISNIIITILNYYSIIPRQIIDILSLIVIFISFIYGGYLTSRKASKKGYLEGIKYGILLNIIIILLNLLLFKNKFNLISILFYILTILSSMIGGMIGIRKRKI